MHQRPSVGTQVSADNVLAKGNAPKTLYAGESSDISHAQLQDYVSLIESGELTLQLGPNLPFEKLHEAHTMMDENRASGKIVIEVA